MEEQKYQLATKAIMFAPICENNFVAAAILDYVVSYAKFYQTVEDQEPFKIYVESAYGYLDNPSIYASFGYRVNVDANLLCPTIDEIRAAILPHFVQPCEISDRDMKNALELLDREGFLYLRNHEDEEWFTDSYFELDIVPLLYTSHVDVALVEWFTGKRVVPAHPPVFDRARERKIVRKQCERVEQSGQAGTLTLEEWLNTLQHFQGRCAFDPQHHYQVLEHFIPVSLGGGTTVFNCIPACYRCNAAKRDRHPSQAPDEIIQKAIPALQRYLDEQYERWLKQANEQSSKKLG